MQDVLAAVQRGEIPKFFKDANGTDYLAIHGSMAQDGQMYFGGDSDPSGNGGGMNQSELADWIRQQGYNPSSTKLIACHGGQLTWLDAPGLTPAFDYNGEVELGVQTDASGNESVTVTGK